MKTTNKLEAKIVNIPTDLTTAEVEAWLQRWGNSGWFVSAYVGGFGVGAFVLHRVLTEISVDEAPVSTPKRNMQYLNDLEDAKVMWLLIAGICKKWAITNLVMDHGMPPEMAMWVEITKEIKEWL